MWPDLFLSLVSNNAHTLHENSSLTTQAAIVEEYMTVNHLSAIVTAAKITFSVYTIKEMFGSDEENNRWEYES